MHTKNFSWCTHIRDERQKSNSTYLYNMWGQTAKWIFNSIINCMTKENREMFVTAPTSSYATSVSLMGPNTRVPVNMCITRNSLSRPARINAMTTVPYMHRRKCLRKHWKSIKQKRICRHINNGLFPHVSAGISLLSLHSLETYRTM